jgi:hypothetical protein
MSTKSNNVKKFVTDTGSKKQLFVFVGSNSSDSMSNSSQTSAEIWNNSDFSVRIGQNSLVPVVRNIKWTQQNPYIPWSSLEENTGNFYAYNNQTGYVYLCISDNEDNRTDKIGYGVSRIRPTHTSGTVKYADGYSWKVLYKITGSLERFVSAKWIPVVSFDIFDSGSQSTNLEMAQSFCGVCGTSEIGQCAIYSKTALSTDDDAGTFEYLTGDLFTTAENISCSDCYYFMKDNDQFLSKFYSDGETIPTSITINDPYTLVGELISNNELSSASPYYHLYNINENDDLDEGSIVSAFIDLSQFTNNQLIVSSSNPLFSIISNSGSGGTIRLKTFIDSSGNNIIKGMEVVNTGSGYKDITLDIDSSILDESLDKSQLLSAISINLDTIDGLAFDPVTVLNAQHVMIDARLEKQTIQQAGIGLPDNINFFGLVENPIGICGSTEVTSGSNLNKKRDVIFRTTTKVQVSNPASASLLPLVDEVYDVEGTTNPLTDVLMGGTVTTDEIAKTSEIEVKNIIYTRANELVGKGISGPKGTSPKLNSTIDSILEQPDFIQYSGKILSTTKLSSNLNVADTDSVIIRINIVKGM